MHYIERLADPQTKGEIATLIDCRLEGDTLHCGFAFFRGGLMGEIELVDMRRGHKYSIEAPTEVRKVATWFAISEPDNSVEIKLYSLQKTPLQL